MLASVREFGDDVGGVRGLSKALAGELCARGRLDRLEVVDRRKSAVDPFVKYLFRSGDGRVFEAVRIPLERPRFSVCLSTQVGCALGCAFCATGFLGLRGNLTPGEIYAKLRDIGSLGVEKTVVPQGMYFVLGDNSRDSFDSRFWGFVDDKDIIGVPYLRVWPLSRFGGM